MIVSFNVTDIEDLELLLSLTKRLGIERVETGKTALNSKKVVHRKQISSHENDNFDEINDEIDNIFGVNNTNVPF